MTEEMQLESAMLRALAVYEQLAAIAAEDQARLRRAEAVLCMVQERENAQSQARGELRRALDRTGEGSIGR